jgi:hypothetical protein
VKRLIIALAFLVVGCASPEVDRVGTNFDAEKYALDLDTCRGGTLIEASLDSVGIALIGAAIGASHGAVNGTYFGDTEEGAIIGAIVGGTLGLGVGAVKALSDKDDAMTSCLRDKGYVVTST